MGNVIVLDGTSTYLMTGPVLVGHSLTDWVFLELELELWLLELHWGSARLGLISWVVLHSGSARTSSSD